MIEIPRECACGCGTPINEKAARAVELRRAGMPRKQVAAEVGCSEGMVTRYCRVVVRFVKGHQGRGWEYETRECVFCGAEFRVPRTARRVRCGGLCPALGVADNIALNMGDFDQRALADQRRQRETRAALIGGREPTPVVNTKKKAEREGYERMWNVGPGQRVHGAKKFPDIECPEFIRQMRWEYEKANPAERETLGIAYRHAHRLYRRWKATVGDDKHKNGRTHAAKVTREAREAAATATHLTTDQQEELARLIAEQTADDKRKWISSGESLDRLADLGVMT